MDRKAVAVDVHGHHRRLRGAADMAHRDHLTDVHPGDPYRRGDVELGLRGEHGAQNEGRGAERQRSPEDEVDDKADHGHPDEAGQEIRDERAMAPHGFPAEVVCVVIPTFPDGLPMTGWAAENGSLPAEHSRVCPGDAVLGYGFTCNGPWASLGLVSGVR